eukprot:942368-Rhodomonas_salina.3
MIGDEESALVRSEVADREIVRLGLMPQYGIRVWSLGLRVERSSKAWRGGLRNLRLELRSLVLGLEQLHR